MASGVVDFDSLRPDAIQRVCQVVTATGARFVGLTSAGTLGAATLLDIAARYPVELVVGWQETIQWVSTVLGGEPRLSVPNRILRLVTPRLRLLPMFRDCSCGLFAWMLLPKSAIGLVGSSGRLRSLERSYRRVGLSGPARILSCARIARAWELVRCGDASKSVVACRVGIESVRTLESEWMRILTLPMRSAQRALTDDDVALEIAAAAQQPTSFELDNFDSGAKPAKVAAR